MKKVNFLPIAALGILALSFSSCKKCHECHYDKAGAEIELGEYCGDDLEELEANGYTDTSGTYTAHCHEH